MTLHSLVTPTLGQTKQAGNLYTKRCKTSEELDTMLSDKWLGFFFKYRHNV